MAKSKNFSPKRNKNKNVKISWRLSCSSVEETVHCENRHLETITPDTRFRKITKQHGFQYELDALMS